MMTPAPACVPLCPSRRLQYSEAVAHPRSPSLTPMPTGADGLRAVDVVGGAVRTAGIVELEPTEAGIVLHRMPAWGRAQHNDIALPLLETMPSGGRLEMVTTRPPSSSTYSSRSCSSDRSRDEAVFDLVVDGELVGAESTRTGTLIVVDRATGAAEFQIGRNRHRPLRGAPDGQQARGGVAAARSGRAPHRARTDGAVPPLQGPSPPVGALRQLDLALPRGRRPTGVWPVVGHGWPASTCRASGSRAVPARPVRGQDDRPATGRPHQPQARHQPRERRLDPGADVRSRRPRLPRHRSETDTRTCPSSSSPRSPARWPRTPGPTGVDSAGVLRRRRTPPSRSGR